MGLRAIVGLAAVSTVVVLAGWTAMGHFAVGTVDVEALAAAAEPVEFEVASVPKSVRPPAMRIADAAIVDSSLFDPNPTLRVEQPAPASAAVRPIPQAASRIALPSAITEPEHTGALAYASASGPAFEVKRPPVPKLDKNTGLTPAHIAQIRANLRLTPDQERHWEPIEAELRELGKQLAAQKQQGKTPKLSADAAQRLYWTAGPLIMSLRDDQKQEARRLARAMGLEQVAALL
jgi:hypothetical protein